MKIVQVVTYISPKNEFGGPTSVAFNQAAALARAGHDVTIYAGTSVGMPGVQSVDGYTVRLFPVVWWPRKLGFASMGSPRLESALWKVFTKVDIIHIHLARDFVSLPAANIARMRKVPYVVQTHGMIDPSTKLLAVPLDRFLTRPVLRDSSSVLVLTEQESAAIHSVEPLANVFEIKNGIEVGDIPNYTSRPREVLFLARLHERKRPLAFVRMSEAVCAFDSTVTCTIVGPDEGEGERIEGEIAKSQFRSRIRWIGPVPREDAKQYLRRARVYVLPARDEVFPMTMLEAFREGTPVVTTTSLGIASACAKFHAALLTDGSPQELAKNVLDILNKNGVADELRLGAFKYLQTELNIDTVERDLERIYSEAIADRKSC